MRIDGVRDGKTAFEAGIEKGDIVLKMGEYEIVDMKTYMESLAKFEPGQSTTVVVSRKGKRLEKEVTFQ
jgi:S1-C subfamily serine protease